MGTAFPGTTVYAATKAAVIALTKRLAFELGPYNINVNALAPGFILTVTLEDDHLESQATNQPKLQIFAEAPDKFFYKVVDAQLEFGRDASGAVTQVTLHQGARTMTGKKQN